MNSFALLAWASLAASRTFLQWLLVFLNFTLDSEDLSFWHKRKKWFVWTTSVAQVAGNHGDEWGLTWHFWWGIYSSILTWTHSQNSLAAAEVLSLKIFPMEHLLNDYKDHPNQHENSHKLCDETGIRVRTKKYESQPGIRVGNLTIWVRSFEIEKF